VGGERVANAVEEQILRRQEEDLLRRQQELALSKAAAARAVAEFAALRPNTETDGAERLVGLDAIQSRLEVLGRTWNGNAWRSRRAARSPRRAWTPRGRSTRRRCPAGWTCA
jgi:hypothetical protein